jgi:hypothetical protein
VAGGLRRIQALVLHAQAPDNATLSYQRGWPRHLARHPALAVDLVNVLESSATRSVAAASYFRRRRWDVVIALHSTCSNAILIADRLAAAVARVDAPVVLFFGNEYKLMPEKLALADRLETALVVSQFENELSLASYRSRLACAVIGIPNTGLDTELFTARTPRSLRSIDVGYRAYESPLYLGHAERPAIADSFARAASRRGLATDISLDPARRLAEPKWAAFLESCKGQLGTEAGGDYFELDDRTRLAVNAYLEEHPSAGIEKVRAHFFRDYANPVPGRALSGRVVEAAGTKTVQLLLEGEYGGYFRPNEHYIPVRKDFSNVDEALDMFADEALCAALVEAAHSVAVEQLTYPRLIDRLLRSVESVLR